MKDTQLDLSAGDSLFTSVRWPRAKQPKRADVLQLLDKVIPWLELESLVRPYYQSDKQRSGRPGVSLKMLIRCSVLQRFWSLGDDALEAFILDSHSAAKFIGSDPWQPRPPSASRMRDFRKLLERNLVEFDIRGCINQSIYEAGFQFRPGFIREPEFKRRQKQGLSRYEYDPV